MTPQAIVAIILALTVLFAFAGHLSLLFFAKSGFSAPEITDAYKATLAAIIGALSVYIAGRNGDK